VALNKAHTSIWVKVLIIVLIVAFVSLFMYQGLAGLLDLFRSNPQTAAPSSTVDFVAATNQQNRPIVDALTKVAASDPTSYTAAARVANAYFDWARALSQPQSGQSQPTTSAIEAAFQEWGQAKAAYDAADKLSKTFDPSMQTDRSYAAFSSDNATSAIEIITTVTKKAPTFAQAWIHLGLYYEALGDGKSAIPAYQKGLALDPKGQNAAYVKERLKALGAASVTPSSTPTSSSP
jgi:tetratricopeptide (TPR) repeat protein